MYSFGHVVLVSLDYTDLTGMKARPAVVVSDPAFHAQRQDAVVAAITSSFAGNPRPGEVDIHDWTQAGLQGPSRMKAVLFTRDFTLIKKKLGRLSVGDRDQVRRAIATIFGFSLSAGPAATSTPPTGAR